MYSLLDALPYLALMLALAFCPLVFPKIWHRFEKPILAIIGFWAVAVILVREGASYAFHSFGHIIIHEYIPFIAIVFALFTVAGGVHVQLKMADSLKNNIVILVFGGFLANFIGTTGASMILIRPFLKLNANRPYKTHLVVFFIFIISNIGGSLTPLGDSPLFMGYLAGVDFSWPLAHGWLPFLVAMTCCLIVFGLIDAFKNKVSITYVESPMVRVDGKINLVFMVAVVLLTLLSPKFSGQAIISLMGTDVTWQGAIRDLGYIAIGCLSLWLTPKHIHLVQEFDFAPLKEVARVFLVIFLSLIPISAMLKLGETGPFSSLFGFVTDNGAPINFRYFWASGSLSAFLDNAPTYLLFFKMAGGDAQQLMQKLPATLLAISLGSVYMGAMSYIGNAPNFMVRSIASQSGVQMPSFLGYMVWSCAILLPILYLVSLLIT